VTNGEAGLNWILSANDVDVGSTNGSETHLDHCVSMTGRGNHFLFQPELARCAKNVGVHYALGELLGLSLFQFQDHVPISVSN
jgi:hypothetical protein